MLLSLDQGLVGYTPATPPEIYFSLQNGAPQYFESIPITELPKHRVQIPYATDADLPGNANTIEGILPVPGAPPPAFPADKTLSAWGDKYTRNRALFHTTRYGRAFVVDNDQNDFDFNETANDIRMNVEIFGRELVTDTIQRFAVPGPNRIGGIAANLAGWTDAHSGEVLGYDANVLLRQTVPGVGLIFNYNPGTGGLGNLNALDRALTLVNQPNLWIVPNRFVEAYRNEWRRGNTAVNADQVSSFSISGIAPVDTSPFLVSRVPTMLGIPMLVLPDQYFADAGHTVAGAPGAADYDIYLLSTNAIYNNGAGLRIYGDSAVAQYQNSFVADLGMGMKIENTGRVQTETGVYNVTGMELYGKYQFIVGRPDAAAIVQGVTD